MPPLVNGLLFGLIFIFAIGPSFFLLIQNSVEYGFRRGALIALGISLSDILFVSLTLIGMSSIISDPANAQTLSIIAAIILVVFGVYYFLRKPKIQHDEVIDGHGALRFLFKGFLINIFNPTIILFWITMSSTVSANYSYTWSEQRNFFIGMLITILVSDLAKAYLANHVRSFITVRSVQVFNRVVGSALVIFAASLLFSSSMDF
jgi:threonine/homoserine/homoserine lactone efflux protein